MTDATPMLLTARQVAELLQISLAFVYENPKELGLVKVGGANRYPREALDAYVARRSRAQSDTSDTASVASPSTHRRRSRAGGRKPVRLLK